ncbi:MAG: tail assembly chaperone [Peptoniphilaceae bacterium]|nr:tail assembly chaperone [Anaerococcus sp.]MDD7044524.1 tail assembly chaperone [Peptoniphilaceae bacterium]
MILNIKGNDYELNFGLKFCRDISKDKARTENGIDIRVGIENAVSALYTGDVLILPSLIRAGLSYLSKKPSDKDIEDFLDSYDDLEGLCDDFLSELLEQSATKKKALAVYTSLEEAKRKEESKKTK